MKLPILAIATFLCAPSSLLIANDKLDDRSVIFSGQPARDIFQQHSRSASDPSEGLWTPTPEQVNALLERLPKFFTGASLALGGPLDSYLKQFAGFHRNGRRMIYLNALGSRYGRGELWRTKAMVAFHGYPSFWGIEYDVESHEFANFAYNNPF